MSEQLVRCEITDSVATITLASPLTRNALSVAFVAELDEALARATRPAVRVIVLTHAAPVFSAGFDLKERLGGLIDSQPMVDAVRTILLADQPVIAAVKGPVRAAGVGLMAACDLIVVAESVDFAFTEVRLGLTPAIIAVPVLRRVPAGRMAAAFLTGEPFGARAALELGLVTHVAPDAPGVDAQVEALVAGVLQGAPGAVALTKRVLREVPGPELDADLARMRALSDELFRSPEGTEGMRSFVEKRPPSWRPPAP